jgi:hypothetical protein
MPFRNLSCCSLIVLLVPQTLSSAAALPTMPLAFDESAATVDSAAHVLDLRTLEMPEKASDATARQVGELTYDVPINPKSAFEFHRRQLTGAGWSERPGTQLDASYASGMFAKAGFTISVSTFLNSSEGDASVSHVSLINHGNIAPAAVPIFEGTTSIFANEATSISTSDLTVANAADAMHKLLTGKGWQPYGRNDVSDDQRHLAFRKNAIQASLMISRAPAQDDKTSIMISTLLLAAEIPAPVEAAELQFDGGQKVLRFNSVRPFADVADFYMKELSASGWKPTTPVAIESKDDFDRPIATQVFRNAGKDIITLDMARLDEATEVTVRHQTLAEFEDALRQQRLAAEQLVAQREADEKAAEADRKEREMDFQKSEAEFDALAGSLIADALGGSRKSDNSKASGDATSEATSIAIPKGATVRSVSDNVLQVTVKAGQGKATAESIVEQLQADGWEADEDDLEAASGSQTFTRDDQTITLTYADPGRVKVKLMLIAVGVNLKSADADDQ